VFLRSTDDVRRRNEENFFANKNHVKNVHLWWISSVDRLALLELALQSQCHSSSQACHLQPSRISEMKSQQIKMALAVLFVSAFGFASLADAAPRHPHARNSGGGGVFQRSVPSYQYQSAYRSAQPMVIVRNAAPAPTVVNRTVVVPQAPAVATQVVVPVKR
jgi:hypothetical protein